MLRSFRVANHKSIRDEQELLLMPAYDKSRQVVPVAAIFGANASGKSNLLDALFWMRSAVQDSFSDWKPGGGVPRRVFKLSDAGRAQPSTYAIDLIIDEVPFHYGFEVDDEVIRVEWLHTYPQRRKRVVFERELDSWTFGSTVPQSRYESTRTLTRPNALFLSVGASTGLREIMPIYQWFQHLSMVTPTDEPYQVADPFFLVLEEIHEYVRRSEGHRHALVELLRAADLGIADILVAPKHDDHDRARRELASEFLRAGVSAEELLSQASLLLSEQVLFAHGQDNTLLDAGEESFGTRAWLRLLMPVLAAFERGSLVCVDEIDASLHPHLTERLIELFKDEETNRRRAQLVFTTHDASLLDEDVLGRDEVWFVEKDSDSGATRLYPLTDFHPRKYEDRVGRYLVGSYGAVPAVSRGQLRRALRVADADHVAA